MYSFSLTFYLIIFTFLNFLNFLYSSFFFSCVIIVTFFFFYLVSHIFHIFTLIFYLSIIHPSQVVLSCRSKHRPVGASVITEVVVFKSGL